MIKIIPAILVKDKKEFKKQWSHIADHFKYIQIDIMDGEFVKDKTNINPYIVKDIIKNKALEIHLMVDSISKYITTWSKVKNVKKIIWHYEANTNIDKILKFNTFLKKKKIKTGLAINPNTKLKEIEEIIKDFHTIQIMGVTPGKQGQRFQNKVLNKIKSLKKDYPKVNIEVDGGVNNNNFKKIKKAGANLIAIGSYLQKSKSVKESLNKLK